LAPTRRPAKLVPCEMTHSTILKSRHVYVVSKRCMRWPTPVNIVGSTRLHPLKTRWQPQSSSSSSSSSGRYCNSSTLLYAILISNINICLAYGQETLRERNQQIALYMFSLALATLGVSYASVPLYKVFCQVR
jgi:hypothetical protein